MTSLTFCMHTISVGSKISIQSQGASCCKVRLTSDIDMSSIWGRGCTTRISWRCACSMIVEAKRPMLESRLATCSSVPLPCHHLTDHTGIQCRW